MKETNLTDSQIKEKFNELLEDSKINPQSRGFAFEKIIKAKLDNEQLEPRAGYKPTAEQIDGSFFWEGRTFLLEAKWEKDKLPASSLYAFQGKLNGKFHNTSGVFLAVNGYGKDAEEALKVGKSLNILLFDGSDIRIIFNNEVSFLEVLKFKLRQAGDTGSLNVPYEIKKEVQTIVQADLNYIHVDDLPNISPDDLFSDFLVFVEGRDDVKPIQVLLNSLKSDRTLSYKIVILEGANKIIELPALVNQYLSEFQTSAVLIILDEDRQEELKMDIKSTLEQIQNSSIFINTKFLFIDKLLMKTLNSCKKELSKNGMTLFKETILYKDLKGFIQNIIDECYYDPTVDLPNETFHSIMNEAQWDYKKKVILFTDDLSGHPFTIENVEELVQHLNDGAGSAMDGEMPLAWLNEQDGLDYDWDAREFLLENYKKEIIRLKWDINAL